MSSSPLRVAILWHQHQPYYKRGDHYLLPWTRLHATKDYLDMALALERYPSIRQTTNVVPSLLIQLIDYAQHGASDRVLDLTRRPASELSDEEKLAILRSFFLCNPERMIVPYARYNELYVKAGGDREDDAKLRSAAGTFDAQDWLDLQVWYTLTWIGPWSREHEPFASLLVQGAQFSEEQKRELVDASLRLLADVIPTYRRLLENGQLELSVTPYYHPILPILCDSYAALEAVPTLELPSARITWPDDARAQVERAITLFTEQFGRRPRGMWPSEGSVSDAALGTMSSAGLEWAATDEGILRRTLGEAWQPTSKYFPWTLRTAHGDLRMLFRDRQLSDAIGFVYGAMDPRAAASDFYQRLVEIRGRILQDLGPAALEQAIVPVILDGENCWEYYIDNGRPFLEALYELLSQSAEISTTTIGEALAEIPSARERSLGHVFAGSWIGSDFRIWIGHEEDNDAWEAVAAARHALMEARPRISESLFAEAMEEVYIAEGSDWYWWFGDEHTAVNQDDFDLLFRYHVSRVYELIETPVPESLSLPIRRAHRGPNVVPPSGSISPAMDGRRSHAWDGAGTFMVESVGGAMHRADAFTRRVLYGSDNQYFYLRFDAPPMEPGELVRFDVRSARCVRIEFTADSVSVTLANGTDGTIDFGGVRAALGDAMMVALPLQLLNEGTAAPISVQIAGALFESGHQTGRFPHTGELVCVLRADGEG